MATGLAVRRSKSLLALLATGQANVDIASGLTPFYMTGVVTRRIGAPVGWRYARTRPSSQLHLAPTRGFKNSMTGPRSVTHHGRIDCDSCADNRNS